MDPIPCPEKIARCVKSIACDTRPIKGLQCKNRALVCCPKKDAFPPLTHAQIEEMKILHNRPFYTNW